MTDSAENPYRLHSIHPEDKLVLDNLTQSKNWDSPKFRQVLITLGTLGRGVSVPSYNRPDSVHLQGWHDIVDDLSTRAKVNGVEYSRTLFVDTKLQKLQFSPRVVPGSEFSVSLDWTPPDTSRSKDFVDMGMLHTHPSNDKTYFSAHGFSGADYVSFIANPEPQVSMIVYGAKNRILLMKTSVTPNNLSAENVKRDIGKLEKEFLADVKSSSDAVLSVINFNKVACVEYGLTMYTADQKTRDQFTRINVAG